MKLVQDLGGEEVRTQLREVAGNIVLRRPAVKRGTENLSY